MIKEDRVPVYYWCSKCNHIGYKNINRHNVLVMNKIKLSNFAIGCSKCFNWIKADKVGIYTG